jgi:hypothetical protein
MVAGSCRLVVVSSIHASVQETSSSAKFSVGLSPFGGGGSVVLQAIMFNNSKVTGRIIFVFIAFCLFVKNFKQNKKYNSNRLVINKSIVWLRIVV